MIASLLSSLQSECTSFEPANPSHQERVIHWAEYILDRPSIDLNQLEVEAMARAEFPLMAHLAIKMARSKSIVGTFEEPLDLSVVFAMYKEHQRIKTRREHPHGEDFLNRKIQQLNWLCADSNLSWHLFPVDDGCPEHSGEIARAMAQNAPAGDRVHVLFLQDGIDQGSPATRPLTRTSDSQKGGSIIYGLHEACARLGTKQHICLFTDADMSTHLGQAGLLLGDLVHNNKLMAVGSRRESTSVVIKKGVRNTRGKLFIYLWKRMLPSLNHIVDTQCGFKAFRADHARNLALVTGEKKFAVDLEFLLRTQLTAPNSICKKGIAWIDSEAASTTTALRPYLPMLKTVAHLCRELTPLDDDVVPFTRFIEDLTQNQWNRLVTRIPEDIAMRNPAEFDRFDGVGVDQLAALTARP